MTRFAPLLALLALLLVVHPPLAVAESGQPPKIAVLPLELMAPQEKAYLVEGVRTMLGSRLAASDQADLLERSSVERELTAAGKPRQTAEFLALGQKLGADYLLTGSLTAIGGAVSLDLALHDIKGPGPARSFFASADNEGALIPAIDRLAREINAEMSAAREPVTPRTAVRPPVAGAPGDQQPTYASPHPERQLYGGWGSGVSPFIRATDISWLRGFSKSHDIPLGLHAMEVADVTGDGELEFILAGPSQVEVYRRELGRFVRIAQVATLNRYPIHYLSAADFNRNGRAEIYVSAADHQRPNSLVLEWDGQQLVRIHDNLPWYIRVMNLPMEGTTLVGQRGGSGAYLMRGLFRLETGTSGTWEQGTLLSLPGRFNLFDFTFVDLDGDEVYEIVAITQNDRLEVMNAAGGRLWISDGHYGGTTRYLGGRDDLSSREPLLPHQRERYFVPARIVVRDITRNGRPDIVVHKNISALSRVFSELRSYSGGEIHALSWDGAGMSEIWRTRRIGGYIADLQMGPDLELPPQEEGGEPLRGAELFVGVVQSDGFNILATTESAIYVYPVEYQPADTRRQPGY